MRVLLTMRHWLLMAGTACGPEPFEFEGLEGNCERKCELALSCDAMAEAHSEQIDRCINACLMDGEESLQIGSACAHSYQELMICIADLSCSAWTRWVFMAEPRPCDDETVALSACPGVWFVPPEAG